MAADGRLYLIGGNQRDVAIYDPATDTWTRGPDLPTARSGLVSAGMDGRSVVMGGGSPSGSAYINVEVLTP